MQGIFNAFSSGQVRNRTTAHPNNVVDAKVNSFAKIASKLNKQLPATSNLNLELLTKVVSEYVSQNPQNTSTHVTYKIHPDESIDLQNHDLIYRISPRAQGLVSELMGRYGADGIKDGIKTLRSGTIENGKFAYIRELRTTELIEGKKTLIQGTVFEGKFAYIPELLNTELTEGRITFTDGSFQDGTFRYNRTLKRLVLTEGARNRNGIIEQGKFSYIPELNRVCLVEGKSDRGSGRIRNGIFVYNKVLNSMQLAKGSVSHPDGKVETGTFSYIPELQRYELVKGRTEKGGNWQEGTKRYVPELGRMQLIEGTVNRNGITRSGTLVYDPSLGNGEGGMRFTQKLEIPNEQIGQNLEMISNISEMTNLFGDSKAISNLNNLLNAWESLNQTTTPQAYAEKVDQLSKAYNQCKKTLLFCAHPDRRGDTETAQQHLESLQKLGRSINNVMNTLRHSEPNFV